MNPNSTGNFALYSRRKGAYLDAMRRPLAPLAAVLFFLAASTAAAGEPPAVCIDRLVVGAFDAAKRPYFHLFEFSRRAAAGGEVYYVYRGWLAKPEGTKVLFDQSFKAAGEPCALAHARDVRVLKPSGDHLDVGVLQDDAPLPQIITEPRRSNAMYAVPLPGGYARVASGAATIHEGGAITRGAAVWLEIVHDGTAGGALPGELTVALNHAHDIWVVVGDLAGQGFGTFTDAAGTYSKGTRNTREESTILLDPDTKIGLPRKVAHTLAWAKAQLDLRYQAPWVEPVAGGARPLVNAILYGDGHATDRRGQEQSITGAAWLLAQEPRKPQPPKTKKKGKKVSPK